MKQPHQQQPIHLHKTIPSLLEQVDSLCNEIRDLLNQNGLSEVIFPTELTARECLNNAVIHGNKNDIHKLVTLDLRIGRKWIWLKITDQGGGFNWRLAKKRILDEQKSSGRGLMINQTYAKRVTFNRSGNQITLCIDKERKER